MRPLRVVKAAARRILSTLDHRAFLRKRAEEQFYRQFIGERRKLIFDIGANRGDKADIFAQLADRVVCVEPSPDALDILRWRFRRNPKINIVAKGVGDSEAPQQLYRFQYDGYNTMCPAQMVEQRFPDMVKKDDITIQMTTLDAMIRQFGGPQYIKIDVEGYEAAVLRGLSQAVPLISFEANLPEFIEETKECIERLTYLCASARFNYTVTEPPAEFEAAKWLRSSEMAEIAASRYLKYMEIYCVS